MIIFRELNNKRKKMKKNLILILLSVLFILNGCKKENDPINNSGRPTIVEVAKSPKKFGYTKINETTERLLSKKNNINLPGFNVYYNEETNGIYAIRKDSSNSASKENLNVLRAKKEYYYFRSQECILSGVMWALQNPIVVDDSGYDMSIGAIDYRFVEELIIYGNSQGVGYLIGGDDGTFRVDFEYRDTVDGAVAESPEGWIFKVWF